MLRRPSSDAAVWSRRPGVLWRSQFVEAGGHCRDPGPLRPGLHHSHRQRPPQVNTPDRHVLDPPQEHPRGPGVGDQRHLGDARAPGTAARSQHQVPAARQRGPLHTGAQAVQRRERAEKCRSGSGASAEVHGSLLQLKNVSTSCSLLRRFNKLDTNSSVLF